VNLEDQIESRLKKGDFRGAATKAVEGYGPEVFGFLVTVLRNEYDASEVFSQTCEDMWRGIHHFEGRCTTRTWVYAVARHALARFRRSPRRRPGRHVALSEMSEIAERVRSQTLPHLRTSVKDQFAAIRDSLSEDDRALLVLRVDRGMSWSEIARISSPDDDSQDALRRLEARIRKRFQFVKKRIRERALEAGLLREGDS
jgi:RNA polymerase sigma-70 factor (ECF subfamily)